MTSSGPAWAAPNAAVLRPPAAQTRHLPPHEVLTGPGGPFQVLTINETQRQARGTWPPSPDRSCIR